MLPAIGSQHVWTKDFESRGMYQQHLFVSLLTGDSIMIKHERGILQSLGGWGGVRLPVRLA